LNYISYTATDECERRMGNV